MAIGNLISGVISLSEVPDKLKEIASFALEALETYQDGEKAREQARALKEIDIAGREIAESKTGDALIVEELAHHMNRFAGGVKPDGDIFPEAYRQEFTEEFLSLNPRIRGYQKEVRETIRRWFVELENALRDSYSPGERVLLRHEILNRMDMDEIKRYLEEILDQLRGNQPPETLQSNNRLYRTSFEEPLFLHNGRGGRMRNDKVNLSNLFVHHRFNVESGRNGEMELSEEAIDDYLAQFVRKGPQFLFIEGTAGCGKSSLTAYLSYHYEMHDETAQKIFGDTKLITVRLRNLESVPDDVSNAQWLTRRILRFLYRGKGTDESNIEHFRKAGPFLLLLDGYDELCTIEKISDYQSVLWQLKNLDCKIIITTRPNYIGFHEHDKRKLYRRIALQHFDADQRKEWLEHYTGPCGETLENVNRQYLEHIRDGGICDTPLGLYMVAAGRFDAAALDNEWAIYRQIFYTELSETEYNQLFKGLSAQHSISEYRDSLYRVSEEIAWYLYKNNNQELLISDKEIERIIGELGLAEDKEAVVKRCFALCGYWKTDTKRGYVEFYHNNIRDFFLCEKLMRELNRAYKDYGDVLQDEHGDILPFLRRLCELFQYGKLERMVLQFLRQRSAYSDKDEPDLCIEIEREHHHTIPIFENLLLRGDPYSVCHDQMERENPVEIVARILRNTVGVYRSLYEPFLKENERIHWWRDIEAVNRNATFQRLAEEILSFAGQSDLSLADLNHMDLSLADLCHADLHHADLCHADLRHADLCHADLRHADLCHADLHYAVLQSADLRDAKTEGCDMEGIIGTPIT